MIILTRFVENGVVCSLCTCVSVSLCRRVDVEGACTDVLVMFVLIVWVLSFQGEMS